VPGGNLAALNKTTTNGKGSTRTKKVGVVLKAHESTRRACSYKVSRDKFSLHIKMVDDDGDLIFEETRSDLTCNRRIRQQKFMVEYDVENCEGSVAPSRNSKGKVTVTATTTDGGELVSTRTLKCKK
jgi:hypothetical protein